MAGTGVGEAMAAVGEAVGVAMALVGTGVGDAIDATSITARLAIHGIGARDARGDNERSATRRCATSAYHPRVADTTLLYATNAYLRQFDAIVQAVTDDGVILDQTAFYPTGGGQPHDLGTLRWDGGSAKVVEVRKQGDAVLHKLEGSPPPVSARVHGEIDWDRRYALMRHHTALHSMSGVIFQLYGATVTGGQMYTDRARMDFQLPDLSAERLHAIEQRTNELLAQGHPVSIHFLSRTEALDVPDLIRTRVNLIPESVQQIRVVNIEGIDQQADGGTHVNNTSEVGYVRIIGSENKGKGNKRVEIALEAQE